MWLRFVLAFCCLILAFACALFSTVAREQGHFWATLVMASLALLLATMVGVTTVPVLARQVAGDRVRDAFQFDVTRVGVLYVASIVLIGIAALNTGNNLLYIVVAVMLGAILISGIASAVILRSVELEVRIADRVFAGQRVKAVVKVRNIRKRLPVFSLVVKPVAPAKSHAWQWVRSTFTFPPGRPNERVWLTLPDRQLKRVSVVSPAPILDCREVYLPFLAAGEEQSAEIEVMFARRGCYQAGVFGIRTRFPFAFLAKTRHIRSARRVFVYPRLQPSTMATISPQINGEIETFSRGQGSELYRVREYQAQDSVRHVDWKATAKAGSLMVHEFTRDDEVRVRMVFDNPAAGLVSETQYEEGVSIAASLAWHLTTEGKNVSYLAPGLQAEHSVDDFLKYLATVEPAAEELSWDHVPNDGALNVIVTARSAGHFELARLDRWVLIPFKPETVTQTSARYDNQ